MVRRTTRKEPAVDKPTATPAPKARKSSATTFTARLEKYLPGPTWTKLKAMLDDLDALRLKVAELESTNSKYRDRIGKHELEKTNLHSHYQQQKAEYERRIEQLTRKTAAEIAEAAMRHENTRIEIVQQHAAIVAERDALKRNAADVEALRMELQISELRRADVERWLALLVNVPGGAAAAAGALNASRETSSQVENLTRNLAGHGPT